MFENVCVLVSNKIITTYIDTRLCRLYLETYSRSKSHTKARLVEISVLIDNDNDCVESVEILVEGSRLHRVDSPMVAQSHYSGDRLQTRELSVVAKICPIN